MFRLLILNLFAISLFSQSLPIDSNRLRAHIRFLSSDLLEGRAPGTRGGQLTEQYLASAFEAAGAKVQMQAVPLVGVSMEPGSKISIDSKELTWRTEVYATIASQQKSAALTGSFVFAGYGMREVYANSDVRGKIVVLLAGNAPGQAASAASRPASKLKEAAQLGAAGVLILSKMIAPNAGREQLQLQVKPGAPVLSFSGTITEAAAQKLGWAVADLTAKAAAPDFQPVALPGTAQVELKAALRTVSAHNVIATIAGADAVVGNEQILYSAHWDHLGMSASGEDRIFNGAVDNATGCAALIEVARAWASLEPKPKRSAVFIATTGEESGLLGATYYAANPVFPLQQVKLGLNLDGLAPGPKPTGFFALGPANTEAWPLLEEGARRLSVPLRPDPKPELGYLFRADHFALMNAGVPAYSLLPLDEAGQFSATYMSTRYHKTNDEYSPDWDMTANETMSRLVFIIGLNAASRP
jgi:hypothetical protein